MAYLRSVSQEGVFWAEYKTPVGQKVKASFRLSHLPSDIYILKEVGIGDCYRLPQDFEPDVVIDGGGSNGMFALSVLKRWPRAKLRIFEPVLENLERIHAHLQANGMSAEVYPYCLGGKKGARTFYCREPGQGSFFADLPYTHTMNVEVVRLTEHLENDPRLQTLIKLDIEGAELEVLEDILQIPRPNIFIVGELHNYKLVREQFLAILEKAGFTSRFFDASERYVIFHAYPDAKHF